MTRLLVLLIASLVLLPSVPAAEEVVVTGFPQGVGISVGKEFFKPYYPALQAVADSLGNDPLAIGLIIGSADGLRYAHESDAKNPGLALGRAHVLRDLLITEFKVKPGQLVVQSIDVTAKGPGHRYASVRVVREVAKIDNKFTTRIDSLERRAPIEKHFTEIREIPAPFIESFGLRFGGGVATSPFGGLPVITGAVSWQQTVFVEAIVGYTFWTGSYAYESEELDTRRRLAGAEVIVYPWENRPLGFVGGWIRTEQVSDKYYEYVRLSEGPVLGIRVLPLDHLAVTGAWNPSKERRLGAADAATKNDRFLLSLTAFFDLGGDQ